jgi:predicted MFS family arabinose efflux permease
LGATAFIVTADVRVINPLLHIIAQDFQTDIGSAGFIVTAYTIPYGLFQLVYGPLGDYLGKLRVMTVAMAMFAFGTAICAAAPSLLILDLLRFLTGVAAAALIPLSIAYIGDNFAYQERQAAIGQFLGAVALGNILSTSLGGIVADFLSWRYIFLLYGLVSIGVFIALWRVSHNLPDQTTSKSEGGITLASFKPYYQLMKQPATRLVIAAVFIEGLFFFGSFAFLGAFLKDAYDLPYLGIGFILAGFGIGSLLYTRSVKWFVRHLGENGLMLYGGLVACGSYLLIALVHSWILFIPLNILMGLGYYMIHSTLQTKATELAPSARGTAVSLFAFSLFLGQGIGAALLGVIINRPDGYTASFCLSGVVMALLSIWLVWHSRRYTTRVPITDEAGAAKSHHVIVSD